MMKKYLAVLALAVVMTGCGTGNKNQTETSTEVQTEAETITEEQTTVAESEEGEGDESIKPKRRVPLQEGSKAPDFTANLLDGTTFTLSELQGKPVIINFWATWCGPCVQEMPAFQRLKEDFGDEIGIIAVNSGEDEETVMEFVEENGYTFPVVLDADYDVSMLYPTNGIPYTVILDEEGSVTHLSTGATDADTMYEIYKEALGL